MPTDPSAQRPLLVIVSPGWRHYRDFLFKSVSTRYRIHLVNTTDPTWERRYLTGWTVLADMRTEDVVAAVREIAVGQSVAGVMTWDESKVIQTAWAAKELGLPGGDPDALLRCRDKYATREALSSAGIDQPDYALVGDADAALVAADKIGYPVVLKPRAVCASYGVVLAQNAEEVADFFPSTRDATTPYMPRYDSEVLVEEYLADSEVSVDAAVYEGGVIPMFLAHKQIGASPYFAETGHYVSHDDPLLHQPEMLRVLHEIHAALGFANGWTHTELKLTVTGPKVIEVNGRLGGGLIPYLGMRASGLDAGLAAADVAVGRMPRVAPDRHLVGGVRFFYVRRPETVIDSIVFRAAALPADIDLAMPLVQPGDVVSPFTGVSSGRIALATAIATTMDACRSALDAAEAALTVRTR